MKSRMNIFLTTSKKNLYLAYPAIISLFEHNRASEIFLYLASEDLTEGDLTAEKEQAERFGHHIVLCRFDEEACRKQVISSDPEHWPVGAMSCYWMFHELLPQEVERVLAIEADTVTIAPFQDIYDIDLEGNYAACPDPEHKPLNHHHVMEKLQGDVLTFVGSIYDVKKIREDFTLQDILEMDGQISKQFGQSQMELTFGVLFKNKIKFIPAPTYSIEENRHFAERFGYDYMKQCEETCRLLHFSSTGDKEKPWNPTNIMPGYRYWWAYAEKSPYYKGYFEGQWEFHERLKKKNNRESILLKIIELLKKNEKLVFWNRCRLHRNKSDFRHLVLDGYRNPDLLELHTYGREYEGMTIYLADEKGSGMGFFAELGVTLIKLYFADERGFVPYVSWGKDYLYYEPDGIDGEKNAFLYFFEPVSGVKSIEHACHVLRSEDSHYNQVKTQFHAVSYDLPESYVDAMARMAKKYIRYNDKTRKYLEQEYKKLLGTEKTVGVHFRGTDFRKGYNNHPVPVQIEQEIEKVRELMDKSGYTQVFLATDEQAAVDRFREAFGDRVFLYEDTYRDQGTDESIAFSEDGRAHHHYMLAREVLRDQYTLLNCDGLVCGYSNVTFLARVMRKAWYEKDWDDYVLIDNGLYHNKNSFGASGHGRG